MSRPGSSGCIRALTGLGGAHTLRASRQTGMPVRCSNRLFELMVSLRLSAHATSCCGSIKEMTTVFSFTDACIHWNAWACKASGQRWASFFSQACFTTGHRKCMYRACYSGGVSAVAATLGTTKFLGGRHPSDTLGWVARGAGH